MSRDASLDQFVGGDEEASADGSDAGAPADGDEAAATSDGGAGERSATEVEGVAPARATFDWSPDGAACDCCSTSVEKRWRDGDALVCGDCKEW